METDINFWFGIIGIVVTILFGFLSIYLFKTKKYPGNLTFIPELTIGLFDSFVKNFPQISIKYENKNIDQQIVLLKGFLVNTGSIDIKDSLVEECLKLKLPNGFKWLNIKIVDSTSGSKATVEIADNEIINFNLGLFRKNEFIRFEALVDIPQNSKIKSLTKESFVNELKFEHRIADTNKIDKKEIDLNLPKFNFFKIFPTVVFLSMLIVLIFKFSVVDFEYASFSYSINSDSTSILVTAMPHYDSSVDLFELNGEKLKTITINDFNNRVNQIGIRDQKNLKWVERFFEKSFKWIMLIAVFLAFVYMSLESVLSPLMDYKKIKRIRKSLNLDNKQIAADNNV